MSYSNQNNGNIVTSREGFQESWWLCLFSDFTAEWKRCFWYRVGRKLKLCPQPSAGCCRAGCEGGPCAMGAPRQVLGHPHRHAEHRKLSGTPQLLLIIDCRAKTWASIDFFFFFKSKTFLRARPTCLLSEPLNMLGSSPALNELMASLLSPARRAENGRAAPPPVYITHPRTEAGELTKVDITHGECKGAAGRWGRRWGHRGLLWEREKAPDSLALLVELSPWGSLLSPRAEVGISPSFFFFS